MQTVTLNNGVEMPILGLGVYQLTEPGECERVVSEALELGYRSIDTAASYRNEEAVGRAIAASGIPRDELFITSKVWIQDAGEKPARAAFERSLERLGLDYLDLYLIHQPMGDVYGSWRALENINKEGLSRAVGVSNFYPDRLVDLILHNEITPAVNQVETHPFHQQVEAQKVMQEYNVQIESWGPFAEGKNDLFTNPTLAAIAEEHGKSVGQVVLRWLIQRGVVVIPKSARRERLEENINVFDFTLSDAQMNTISTLDTGSSLFIDHNDVSAVTLLSGVKFDT
ncbi:aldo/keto reductase [Corynebacterium durum]|uniref:aldo/keto reductase n=1 Tax=Corynebacterium durum TaxID=61592 RepID=UPI0015CC51FE|nr:aldo/keto reductase [Corynebacterium durum]NYI73724.1 2,5-diketo-D-gluconate reductase A [Corynebacterium durum]WJY85446.1 putative oxidoreductase [Corynebacterium durum]